MARTGSPFWYRHLGKELMHGVPSLRRSPRWNNMRNGGQGHGAEGGQEGPRDSPRGKG